jgi:modification methylase
VVLDPFLGTGTTTFASIVAGRNSIGVEIENSLLDTISQGIDGNLQKFANIYIMERLNRHLEFVNKRKMDSYEFKYQNSHYGFPVMTRQERELALPFIESIQKLSPEKYRVEYRDKLSLEYFEFETQGDV